MHATDRRLGACRDGRAGERQRWYADGVLPAAQVMERSIGVLAGVARADAGCRHPAPMHCWRARLAAKAFSSGDVGQYDTLMAVGTRANLADNPGSAEAAFRAALALQQKALGKDNPNTATALMSLALQLSNEGRYAEADSLFADAAGWRPARRMRRRRRGCCTIADWTR